MAETWECRDTAGAACGPGDREALSETAGSSLTTKALDGTGDTWNASEERSIASGDWSVRFSIDCGTGGGPQNVVNVTVARFNSSCVQQGADIINEDVNVAKGDDNQAYTTATQNPGQVDFASGDIIRVVFTDAGGSQIKTLNYNGSALGDKTWLTHPDEVVAGADSESFLVT